MSVRRALITVVVLLLTVATTEAAARLALAAPAYRSRLAQDEAGRRLVGILTWQRGATVDHPETGRFVHDPRLGWRMRPSTSHELEGATATVDATGRRRVPSSAEGAHHVVLLGDSFTFGDEVDDEETFAWQLAEQTGWRVDNLGVPGHGLDQLVLRLEGDVLADPPDVVVLGVNSPVLARTLARWDVWARPWFVLDDGGLDLEGVPVPTPAASGHLRPLRVLDLLDVWAARLAPRPGPDPVALAHALLERAQGDCAAAGVQLIVAWMPEPDLVREGRQVHLPAELVQWCSVQGRCLDLRPVFLDALADGVVLEQGTHWSPAGHALVARELARALTPTASHAR